MRKVNKQEEKETEGIFLFVTKHIFVQKKKKKHICTKKRSVVNFLNI